MIALTGAEKWGMLVCHPSPSAIFSCYINMRPYAAGTSIATGHTAYQWS